MAKEVSPGVKALRKVVDDVHADARRAHAEGKLVGWSSSKFPCELAAAFDLDVMYPESQAAGIAANRDGEIMCQAAEDLGFDNDICGYARISLAYAAGKRASRKFDPETLEYIINPNSGKPLKDVPTPTAPPVPGCASVTTCSTSPLPTPASICSTTWPTS